MKPAPQRLGRGLASLLGDVAQPTYPAGTTGIGQVAVDQLESNPFQPRGPITPESLSELVESIAGQGVLQPLLVRPHPSASGRYQIIAGERRWRAARQAGLDTVPCYVRPLDDGAATAAALVENLQRQDLNPIEEAEGLRRLMTEFGVTQDMLGRAIGKSRSYVANALRLLQLPASVRAHIESGALSAGHARAALASPNPEALADAVVQQGLSVRQAEALSKRALVAPERQAAETPRDPNLQAVEADLTETLGLAVSISFDGHGGTMRLRYRSLDQLDHLVARLGSGRRLP